MKRNLVIHPFLFALFPVLFLYARNMGKVYAGEIPIPLVVVVGCAALLWFLVGLALKDRKKAGLIVSLLLVIVFSYGHFAVLTEDLKFRAIAGLVEADETLWSINLRITGPECIFALWLILLVAGIYFCVRTRRDLRNLTNILNIAAASLVVISLVNMAVYTVRTEVARQDDVKTVNVETPILHSEPVEPLRDIYYIIFDRYASADSLQEFYGFDNSEFLNSLRGRGFYVANESKTNYIKTEQSLASSLNMKYINYLSVEVGEDSGDWKPINKMMEDYEVWHFLKSQGYTFINFGTWWQPTIKNRYADMNVNLYPCGFVSEFWTELYRTTMVYPILARLDICDSDREQWRRIQYQFNKLAEISEMKEPTFVFAHLLIPHHPYVFDREGNFLPEEESKRRTEEVNYIDQLIYANKKIVVLVDQLLSKSEVLPVIILQADEGPYPPMNLEQLHEFNMHEASQTELRQKAGILNAYYLPDVNNYVLYPTITPVNTFRVVLNLYFNTNLELLPDRTYAPRDWLHPYDLLDITEKIR